MICSIHRALGTAILCGGVFLTGCGGKSGPALDASKQATISGTVTNDGKPLPVDSSVYFSSKDAGTNAAGKLDALGNFNATAPDAKQGITAGRYRVMVRPPAPEQVKPNPSDPKYKEYMMSAGKSSSTATADTSMIPKPFLDLETTKLVLEVVPGPNKFNIDLSKIK